MWPTGHVPARPVILASVPPPRPETAPVHRADAPRPQHPQEPDVLPVARSSSGHARLGEEIRLSAAESRLFKTLLQVAGGYSGGGGRGGPRGSCRVYGVLRCGRLHCRPPSNSSLLVCDPFPASDPCEFQVRSCVGCCQVPCAMGVSNRQGRSQLLPLLAEAAQCWHREAQWAWLPL